MSKLRIEKTETLEHDYAFVVEPVEHGEKKQLVERGFMYWERHEIRDKDNPDYGKYEEMWIRRKK